MGMVPYEVVLERLHTLMPELTDEQARVVLDRMLEEVELKNAQDDFRDAVEADLAALPVLWPAGDA
jgi:hypothetical protein